MVPVEIPKAERIRRLAVEDVPIIEIAAQCQCSRQYVYKVLREKTERAKRDQMLERILSEVAELRSEIRQALGLPSGIVELRLKRIV